MTTETSTELRERIERSRNMTWQRLNNACRESAWGGMQNRRRSEELNAAQHMRMFRHQLEQCSHNQPSQLP